MLNFVFLFTIVKNQDGPYQDDTYLSSSKKDQKNWVNSKMSS